MKKKYLVTRTARELADLLGLHPSVAIEWEIRSQVSKRIIESFEKGDLNVTEVAKLAGTSRARVTKILKAHSIGISLDVLFRVLGALGDEVKLTFKKAA
jgi:predicted XRE-type DNA-binding protein